MLWSSDQNGGISVFFKGKQPRLSTYADAQDKMHPPLLCHTGRVACNSTNVHNKKKALCLIATALMFSLWNEHTRRVYPFCLKCEIKILNLFFSATINHLCKSSDRLHFCLCANNEYKWQFHPFDDSFQRFEGFSIYKREISHINACWHCSQRKTLYKDEVPEELWTSL